MKIWDIVQIIPKNDDDCVQSAQRRLKAALIELQQRAE